MIKKLINKIYRCYQMRKRKKKLGKLIIEMETIAQRTDLDVFTICIELLHRTNTINAIISQPIKKFFVKKEGGIMRNVKSSRDMSKSLLAGDIHGK